MGGAAKDTHVSDAAFYARSGLSAYQSVGLLMGRWIIVSVGIGREFQAMDALAKMAGVSAYCPSHMVWRWVHGREARKLRSRKKQVRRARFAGHIFVMADYVSVSLRSIAETAKGHVLILGGVTCTVSARAIERLRDGEASGNWDGARYDFEAALLARIGSPMLIPHGSLRGFLAVLKRVDLDGLPETLTFGVKLFGRDADHVLDVNPDVLQEVCRTRGDCCQ
jgi:transcription antitermination factor NusG